MIVRNKFLYLSCCALTFSIFLSCKSVKTMNYIVSEKKHQPAELYNDIDFAYKLLKDGHPGVYWFIEKDRLDFKFDSLKNSITTPLTTKEFYRKMAPVIADVKCGHTRLLLVTKKFNKKEKDSLNKLGKPIAQLTYKILNDKLYITSTAKHIDSARKGDEILEINGVPSAEVIYNLSRNFASDGYNTTFKKALLNRSFISWYSAVYDSKDSINFKVKHAESVFSMNLLTKVKTEKKDTITKTKIVKKLDRDSLLAKKALAKLKLKNRYKGSDEFKKPLLDLKFMEKDSSVAYLKVKSFSFPYANFDRFFKESFAEVKRKNAKALILDLRDNGGGSLNACRNLFSYLVDKEYVYLTQTWVDHRYNPYWNAKGFGNKLKAVPFSLATSVMLKAENDKFKLKYKGTKPLPAKKDNFNGRLYVLITGYSFSASALVAANLKQINRATFVGEETGGGYNGCVAGNIPILDLPNSKLQLRMGLYPVVPNAHTTTVGRGIFPDQEVTSTIADVLAGRDKEIDWVLNDIKKKI